jgi:hypothetical protein
LVNFLTEDQDSMDQLPRVQWTIIPRIAPQPWIGCSGCGALKPFESSGKIRLNANGKKLDAWLIYRCSACDKTWNRSIFERQNVRSISPVLLEALQSNDAEWVRVQTFDIGSLRRETQRVDEFVDVDVSRKVLRNADENLTEFEIELAAPLPASIRLDRLLAAELPLSRSDLQALHCQARLRIEPDKKDILRRRIRDRTIVTLIRSAEADLRDLWKAAIGRPA